MTCTFCLILKNIREGRVPKNYSSNSATQESRFDDIDLALDATRVTNIVDTYSKDNAAPT